MSTYVYECIIDFIFSVIYILYVRQLMCIIDSVLWQLLFYMYENFYVYDNLYINTLVATYV